MTHRTGCIVALAMLASPVAGNAQNLVVNGDFDDDLSVWEPVGGAVEWSPFDVAGSADSGSAHVIDTAAAADQSIDFLRQCIAIAEPGSFRVEASGYLAPGGASGFVVARYAFRYDSADCSGGMQASGNLFVFTAGEWQRATSPALVVPAPLPPAPTVEIVLAAYKENAGDSLEGYFDDLSVANFDAIFADGFQGN